jgi:hypothetical protein
MRTITRQLILNIHRTLFLAEGDAFDEGRDFFDIDSRESVLDAYNESMN